MRIKVLRPGLLTTVQDKGRYGFQQQGVIVSGAMDTFALRIANLLVGNAEGEAALEITLLGPKLMFEEEALIAVCGADMSPEVDGHPVPPWRPVYVRKGSVLTFGRCVFGCRAYLAVAGGYAVDQVLGSRSTYLRAEFGGYHGRALREGDVLEAGMPSAWGRRQMKALSERGETVSIPGWSIGADVMPPYAENPTVRVLRGAQFALFTEESRHALFAEAFQVTPQSDRMGYRFAGPALTLSEPAEMISESVVSGTVQVPPGGQPIALLADRQTAGGYPKIAQIISADLPVVAQMKPGDRIRFTEVTLEEAEKLYVAHEMQIQQVKQGIGLR